MGVRICSCLSPLENLLLDAVMASLFLPFTFYPPHFLVFSPHLHQVFFYPVHGPAPCLSLSKGNENPWQPFLPSRIACRRQQRQVCFDFDFFTTFPCFLSMPFSIQFYPIHGTTLPFSLSKGNENSRPWLPLQELPIGGSKGKFVLALHFFPTFPCFLTTHFSIKNHSIHGAVLSPTLPRGNENPRSSFPPQEPIGGSKGLHKGNKSLPVPSPPWESSDGSSDSEFVLFFPSPFPCFSLQLFHLNFYTVHNPSLLHSLKRRRACQWHPTLKNCLLEEAWLSFLFFPIHFLVLSLQFFYIKFLPCRLHCPPFLTPKRE